MRNVASPRPVANVFVIPVHMESSSSCGMIPVQFKEKRVNNFLTNGNEHNVRKQIVFIRKLSPDE